MTQISAILAKAIGCIFFAAEMFNIFAPFIITLTFFNNGARWMGETLLPLYFYNTEKVFIPPLQSSVNFNKVWPLASMITHPVLDVDQELIHFALEFARDIPDYKTCFPEIWDDITEVCSDDSTFVSEYQYTVMTLRVFNCLHHRSLGIEEIDFEFIDQEYGMYLALMTAQERVLYHKMYNVARGLCLHEKQDRTSRDVRHRVGNVEKSIARYLNHAQRIKTKLATSTKINGRKTIIKQGIHSKFTNETGRILRNVKRQYEGKLAKYIKAMKRVVDESNSYSLETSLDVVAKNFRKIGNFLHGGSSLERSWRNFLGEYNKKANEMERRISSLATKLGKIYTYQLGRQSTSGRQ